MNNLIHQNITAHNKIAKKYKRLHTEIYNSIEQARLENEVKKISKQLETETKTRVALDFGCGDGNLTQYLIKYGFHVISADVSDGFLDLVKSKFPTAGTKLLNGVDLSNFENESVDFICTYSVLHHVPDYLKIINEFSRVLKPGGILMIEHEVSQNYWKNLQDLQEFYSQATSTWYKLKKYLILSNYINKFRSIKNPKYSAEGDIHVFPDDHIEWDKIKSILDKEGFQSIKTQDYLLFRGGYDRKVFDKYRDSLVDMCQLIAKK